MEFRFFCIFICFSIVDVWSVEISCLHWTWFKPYSGFQLIYTDIVFPLILGLKKRLSSQKLVSTLNLISQNNYLNRQIFYKKKLDGVGFKGKWSLNEWQRCMLKSPGSLGLLKTYNKIVHQFNSTHINHGIPIQQYTNTTFHQYNCTPIQQFTNTTVHQYKSL